MLIEKVKRKILDDDGDPKWKYPNFFKNLIWKENTDVVWIFFHKEVEPRSNYDGTFQEYDGLIVIE